ncbi:Transcriptional Coactivator p15 (PC4) [Parelusimicrobium proximum]|uniref:PC4/YdbC family ssDNA-binding protein n=1 Tax=Parelusimicrobium proximum TaxID=3228953 RepID=UPI003D169BC1
MTESSFMILQQIGSLTSDDNSEEVKFSVDAYRGYRYASIRKYLKSDSYSGATRAGITMTPEIVKGVSAVLEKLPDDASSIEDNELGKFAKRPGMSVVVRVSSFKGSRGLDLRQWQEDDVYTGWTKKGIRLPLNKMGEIKKLFKQMVEYFDTHKE